MSGFFITFEGLDGSGKTTQLRRLAAVLSNEGRAVTTLRQPGGTPLGDRIRAALLDSRADADVGGIAPETELALMFADRAQSLHQVIRPALGRGEVVLCDRYTDSSEAYQGAGRGLGAERVLALHQAVCDGFQPDLTFLLLPSLVSCLHRARRRNERHERVSGSSENRFELEGDAFYERIDRQYRQIAVRDPDRVVAIMGDLPIDDVTEHVLAVARQRLGSVQPNH